MARRLLAAHFSVILGVAIWVSLGCSGVAQEKAPQRAEEAWWLTATFSPTETSFDGLAASAIDPEWTKVSILDHDKLPAASKEDLVWMHRDGFAFRVERKSKKTGRITRYLCGVYEARNGERGRFLLVLERASRPNAPWKVAFVHKEKGEAGFNVLAQRTNGLYWGTCMQCDEFQKIVNKNDAYELDASSAAP